MILLIVLISNLFSIGNALNILMHCTVIGQSHVSFLNKIAAVLADDGHRVDVVFAHFNDAANIRLSANVGKIHSYGFNKTGYWHSQWPHLAEFFSEPRWEISDLVPFDKLSIELCTQVLHKGRLLKDLKSTRYDVGFSTDYDPCGVIILRALNVTSTASLIPTPLFENHLIAAGLPTPTSLYGTVLTAKHDGSIYDKTFFLLRSFYYNFIRLPFYWQQFTELSQQVFGESFPPTEELERNIDVIFVNSNEIIEKPRPISHKVKYIGGLGIQKQSDAHLPSHFDEILNISNKGTILFSFGTQVPTRKIPLSIRKSFIEAFAHFGEYSFLWKYDDDENDYLFENTTNVFREKWLPQTTLLGDRRIKLFISHMGLNSYLEAAHYGVPVLSIPLFVDQQHNAQNAESIGLGRIIERHQITTNSLITNLHQLLDTNKYTQRAQQIARMMRAKPEQPERTLLEWTNFIGEHANVSRILNLPGNEHNPFWYHSGDVIVSLLFGALVFACVCNYFLNLKLFVKLH